MVLEMYSDLGSSCADQRMAFVVVNVMSVSDRPSIISGGAVHVTQEARSDSDQIVGTSMDLRTRSIELQGDVVTSYR